MTWPVLVAAPLIAWLVGVVFGVAPAVKAARKDPIDALRYE
jgi:putative ABC transport system permease protein